MRFNRQPFRNEFSWSKSRHEKLATCPRSYFFHYYGSWGGWERGADEATRELYTLKKLTSRYAWAGSTVHDGIKAALSLIRDGGNLEPQPWIDRLRARMRTEFRDSREKAYRVRKALGLQEHEYDEPVSGEEWKANWDQVERCLKAFLDSRWIEEAKNLPPERWLPIDELGSFHFEGTKIFAAPDFAFRTEDGGAVLVDWKTGRQRDGDRDQLLGYALYARDTWGVPLEKVDCRVVYLPSLDEVEVRIAPEEISTFSQQMRSSISRMQELLVDPAENVATIDNFPRVDDEVACGRCVFRRPCRGSQAEA